MHDLVSFGLRSLHLISSVVSWQAHAAHLASELKVLEGRLKHLQEGGAQAGRIVPRCAAHARSHHRTAQVGTASIVCSAALGRLAIASCSRRSKPCPRRSYPVPPAQQVAHPLSLTRVRPNKEASSKELSLTCATCGSLTTSAATQAGVLFRGNLHASHHAPHSCAAH